MDTSFPNVDPEGLLYQYETESDETDDVATWLEEEFTEYGPCQDSTPYGISFSYQPTIREPYIP
ncbi:hypothetical protein E4U10_004985 [Claviceps purpurea]|nr:hypothetical protein E4U10_004985 [Claviceps purpurea]KAG6313706.1 hypothetical protein E4U44_002409 [Claviceps purpurea]